MNGSYHLGFRVQDSRFRVLDGGTHVGWGKECRMKGSVSLGSWRSLFRISWVALGKETLTCRVVGKERMFRDGNYGLPMQWVCDSFTVMSGKGMLVKHHVRVS